jgi:hypothetical protein
MVLQSFQRFTRRLSRKLSLRVVFTVPVLLQLIGAVGLVGYLSFRNGQSAVKNLASQLRAEVSARIERELKGYFGAPHAINRLNATAFFYGDLDIVQAQYGEPLLFQQMKIYPSIAFIYCASSRQGEFFGVLRSPDTGQLQLSYYEVLDAEEEEGRSLKLETLEIFERGIDAYNHGQFTEATTWFKQVLERHPQDRTAQLYLHHIEQIQ